MYMFIRECGKILLSVEQRLFKILFIKVIWMQGHGEKDNKEGTDKLSFHIL